MGDLAERALPHSSSSVRGKDIGAPEPRTRVPVLSFFVPGKAIPKGSKTIYRGRLVEAGQGYYEWAAGVASTALVEKVKQQWPRHYEGPVTVLLDFEMARPRRPKHLSHITRPDVDKLARGVLDALTSASVWRDDAQVDKLISSKHYSDTPGVNIVVTTHE